MVPVLERPRDGIYWRATAYSKSYTEGFRSESVLHGLDRGRRCPEIRTCRGTSTVADVRGESAARCQASRFPLETFLVGARSDSRDDDDAQVASELVQADELDGQLLSDPPPAREQAAISPERSNRRGQGHGSGGTPNGTRRHNIDTA